MKIHKAAMQRRGKSLNKIGPMTALTCARLHGGESW